MTKAIVLHETGGPDKLSWESVAAPNPGLGQVVIRHTAIGVNYIDTYMRSGLYPVPTPCVIGQQGVGQITALGDGAGRFKLGEKVAYGAAAIGAYSEVRAIDEESLVSVPGGITDEVCAGTLLRGMTAEYLLFRLYTVKPGDYVLVHAASGGTGVILCQWARNLGAKVIGTVGSSSRFEQAREVGCELVLEYADPDFVAKVTEFTGGNLCDIVYDSVGKDTFDVSLACVKKRGCLAAYGNGSGKPQPLDVLRLASEGSIFLTRPRLDHYASNVAETEACASRFFDALLNNTVVPRAADLFPLSNAALAHRHLENRQKLTTPVLVVEQHGSL